MNNPLTAYLRCWWWCLWHTFQGHCMMTTHGGSGKLYEVAAVTGSLSKDTIVRQKVFYWVPGMTSRPEGY